MKTAMLSLGFVLLIGCESKPAVDPDAPKSAEWESCIAGVAQYADCKISEAGQIDEGIQARVTRQMEGKKNKSVSSAERCDSVLESLPADDPCVPSE